MVDVLIQSEEGKFIVEETEDPGDGSLYIAYGRVENNEEYMDEVGDFISDKDAKTLLVFLADKFDVPLGKHWDKPLIHNFDELEVGMIIYFENNKFTYRIIDIDLSQGIAMANASSNGVDFTLTDSQLTRNNMWMWPARLLGQFDPEYDVQLPTRSGSTFDIQHPGTVKVSYMTLSDGNYVILRCGSITWLSGRIVTGEDILGKFAPSSVLTITDEGV